MNQTFGRVKRQITREPIAVLEAETTANKKATTRKADGAQRCRALRSSLKARLLAAEGPWVSETGRRPTWGKSGY